MPFSHQDPPSRPCTPPPAPDEDHSIPLDLSPVKIFRVYHLDHSNEHAKGEELLLTGAGRGGKDEAEERKGNGFQAHPNRGNLAQRARSTPERTRGMISSERFPTGANELRLLIWFVEGILMDLKERLREAEQGNV